ncbi:MAG: hypothetical protein ABIF40_04730 [archaeon]
MARLIHEKKEVLEDLQFARSILHLGFGLMFAGKNRISKGLCLIMPKEFRTSVTTFFCLHSLEILFVNSKFEVVDKKVLKPWVLSYVPRAKCKYIIESLVGTFDSIKINDKLELL